MHILEKIHKSSLILRIFCGVIVGAGLALTIPNMTAVSLLGTVFVGLLRAIAPILVFLLIMGSLANAAGNIGVRFRVVVALYILSTFLASVIAVVSGYLFSVTLSLEAEASEDTPPGDIGEVFTNLIQNIVANPVDALVNANYISIVFWAAFFGLALNKIASIETRNVFNELADVIAQAVKWIINLAPFGICGLVFSAVSESGMSIFTTYGKLLAILVGCMLVVVFITEPFISFIFLHKNPYPLVFKCFKESGVTAFFTRSSAANIPVNMALCERLGLSRDFYSVSIPLGATINMSGAAVTITVMTLATANTIGINVDIVSALLLSFIATLGACGASGVAGGSLLLIPMAASLFGISNDIAMQVVGIGFIIGVIQDSLETAVNSSGDVIFSATAEYYDRRKNGKPVNYLGKKEK